MSPIGKPEMMRNFDRLNTAGLTLDHVVSVAQAAERSRDFTAMVEGITVGLSSGTSGHRGVFCASARERRRYAGTILAKALPPGGLWRRHRVAFFLRANSSLYETTGSARLRFEFFDLLEPLNDQAERLRTLDPTLLIAPPSLLVELARGVAAGSFRLTSLQRIYSVAEVLDPVDEAFIRRHLGVVHQIYQCTEGFLGITCAHGSLHLNEDLAIIEKEWIDESARKFVPIITDLYRRTQPIVRYRLNDILTEDPAPCACGSVHTRLRMIEGRQDDMIDFPTAAGWRAVMPDFVRGAIIAGAPDVEEYTARQGDDRVLWISLRVKGDVPRAEAGVRQSLAEWADRLGCRAPTVAFDHEDARAPGVKLRRIRRLRAADRLP